MSIQDKISQSAHLIDMDDIVREGYPTLRQVANDVSLPLSDQDIILGEKMLEFLRNSQDPILSEKMGLRGGIGLAANQLGILKRIIACLIPNDPTFDDEGKEIPPKEAYQLSEIMYNPKIISQSVEEAAISSGEGCLSVDREVPGYVPRSARITVSYLDKEGVPQKRRLKNMPAMCVQHEIDHTNGIMFYDHINPDQPWQIKDGLLLIN